MHSALLTHLPVLLSALSLFLPCRADREPYYANAEYNHADWGRYVTQTFKSNPQVTGVPVVNFMQPFTNCDDGSYLMITPRGEAADPTPMILDVTGSPVWAATQTYGQVYNLQVQMYKDQAYLTFWAGNDAVGGHGIGKYFMLDQHYHEQFQVEATKGLGADLHAFTLTPNDTALISIYDKKIANVSSVAGHHRLGWIWDSIFQEIDPATGEAIFEWRANDHIDVSRSYQGMNGAEEGDPWDVYHLNSVEKDALGNYLISVRFLRALLYIDGKTGDVLWQLGGKDNSFHDLSGGQATTFMGQHDAHFLEKDGKKYITFFDNKSDWFNSMDSQSKGLRIELDLNGMFARLDAAMYDPTTPILSTSQGSYQTLPNGHVVLGYGYNGAMAEFSEGGTLLCDAYFQPSSTFGSGDVQSYRNLRFNWTAYPDTTPDLVLDGTSLYMSWNGATEVVTWLLLESDTDERDAPTQDLLQNRAIEDVVIISRAGFETEYQILPTSVPKRFVRVVALDKEGRALGTSEMVDLGHLGTLLGVGSSNEEEVAESGADAEAADGEHDHGKPHPGDSHILIGFGVLAGLSFVLILVLAIGKQTVLWSWRAAASKLDLEKASLSVPQPVHRLADTLLHLRRLLPARFQKRDDFADPLAREGLLADRELQMADSQIPLSSTAVFRPDR